MLDDVGVPHLAEELALLLEALHDALGGGVLGLEEDGVQYLSSAGELVALGLVDGTVRANAEGVVLALDQLYATITETALDLQPLSHGDVFEIQYNVRVPSRELGPRARARARLATASRHTL